jgi:protein-disulfide isomerase
MKRLSLRFLLLFPFVALAACSEPDASPQQAVALGDSPARGPSAAWVTIVEFADFECPYCGRGAQTLRQIEQAYPDDVRVVFKHLPLSMHDRAMPAAIAAECARGQGRFWEMYDLLFSHQQALEYADLEGYAGQIGLDLEQWKGCFSAGTVAGRIEADVAQANGLGISGTPTFYVNGWLLQGAQPFSEFQRLVDRELEKARSSGIAREQYYEKAVLGR